MYYILCDLFRYTSTHTRASPTVCVEECGAAFSTLTLSRSPRCMSR